MTFFWIVILWSIFLILFFVLLIRFNKQSRFLNLKACNITKGHLWSYAGNFPQPSYCSICETFIIGSDGAFCGACGICADQPECMALANASLPCKKISCSGTSMKHHLVKGNLPLGAICCICDEECGNDLGLSDYRCCWCQTVCHDHCIQSLPEECNFGSLRDFIVPPYLVRLQTGRIRKNVVVKQVLPLELPSWTPLIVIGNCSSGSNEGEIILPSFRRILNPAQVLDLSYNIPEEALQWCSLLPSTTCHIVVAGGDGTVGWIFNTIHKMKLKRVPLVSILPLGTGNDLSRVLGWGEEHSSNWSIEDFLRKVKNSHPVDLDRWKVHYTPPRSLGLRMPSREIFMNNYLSIGVDALVTLNFHRTRQSPFYLFSNRTINKMIYLTYGTKDVLMNECKDLKDILHIWMDGQKITTPDLEALVILNIPCWGAGVKPWTMGAGGQSAPKQSINDKKLEVFCLNSSFHIAQLQVGLTEPVRLGQCSSVQIQLTKTAPMQVDGEPWEQHRGVISLEYSHDAKVLVTADALAR